MAKPPEPEPKRAGPTPAAERRQPEPDSEIARRHLEQVWRRRGGEPNGAALYEIATWVSANLGVIAALADPHPALKIVRAELGQVGARLQRTFGLGAVAIESVTVRIASNYAGSLTELNVATGVWNYTWPLRRQQGAHLAARITDNAREFQAHWGEFIKVTAEKFTLTIDASSQEPTLVEIGRLASGPRSKTKEGRPPSPETLFTDWVTRTARVLGLRVLKQREVELLGQYARVPGLEGRAERQQTPRDRKSAATQLRRVLKRQTKLDRRS